MAVHPLFLARLPLLAGLPEEAQRALAATMRREELPRRAVALEKGRRGQEMGFVLSGRLQGVDFTLDGREAGLYFIEAGGFFGEVSVIDAEPAPEYVIAATKCELLRLPEAEARRLLLPQPAAAAALARRLAQRVRVAIQQRSLLALPSPTQRLAALLIQLFAGRAELAPAPTHQELAIMINTTRETVSRAFQTLFAQGVFRRDGERLRLEAPQTLARLAEGSPP